MILHDLRHKAMELAIAQPSEEDEPFTIHKTYEEFLCELIVQECIGCCEQVISDQVPEYFDTWLSGGSQCIEEIKEHFGVYK